MNVTKAIATIVGMAAGFGASAWFWFTEPYDVRVRAVMQYNAREIGKETKKAVDTGNGMTTVSLSPPAKAVAMVINATSAGLRAADPCACPPGHRGSTWWTSTGRSWGNPSAPTSSAGSPPPPGCRFHTRCFMARGECSEASPLLREVAPGRHAACHFSWCESALRASEKIEYLFIVSIR